MEIYILANLQEIVRKPGFYGYKEVGFKKESDKGWSRMSKHPTQLAIQTSPSQTSHSKLVSWANPTTPKIFKVGLAKFVVLYSFSTYKRLSLMVKPGQGERVSQRTPHSPNVAAVAHTTPRRFDPSKNWLS